MARKRTTQQVWEGEQEFRVATGKRIARACDERGLQRLDLARHVGLCYDRVRKLLKGEGDMTLTQLYRFAHVVRRSVHDCLPMDGQTRMQRFETALQTLPFEKQEQILSMAFAMIQMHNDTPQQANLAG